MCGIAGIVSSGPPIEVENLVAMRDALAHRGPDGKGTWISDNRRIGLAHRRLAIIDLTRAANQPMCNEDGTLWVTFNGEIYNHAQIRSELESIGGHHWRTRHSDTEVILHAFEQWGIKCVDKFCGMFAIALWDAKSRHLWLIRDRLGIKPLYYSSNPDLFIFASEIKAILCHSNQRRELDEEAFYHYLSYLTTPAPQTLFHGIRKLPTGSWLRLSENGQWIEHRYWDVLDHDHDFEDYSEEEIAERVRGDLETSVKLRKVSDVPVGVFLSGGIDSSTITAHLSEGEERPLQSFTVGYQGQFYNYQDEKQFARQMAQRVGTEHHEFALDIRHVRDFIPKMIYHQDEPISDPTCVPSYFVAKLARECGVTVCQVGEGADELFCGYPDWLQQLRYQDWSDRFAWSQAKKIGMLILGRFPAFRENIRLEYLRRASVGQPIFWGGAQAFSEISKASILSPRLRDKFADHSSWNVLEPIYRRFQEKCVRKSHLKWMTYLDLNLRLPELLLMRVDKMSMAVGLEARVPFLDHRLVEDAMSIPAHLHIRNGIPKYMLKKTVKGTIPDKLIHRKKQGFGIKPIHQWTVGVLKEWVRNELETFCEQTDLLNRGTVMHIVDRGDGPKTWYLLSFVLWWKCFLQNSRPSFKRQSSENVGRYP